MHTPRMVVTHVDTSLTNLGIIRNFFILQNVIALTLSFQDHKLKVKICHQRGCGLTTLLGCTSIIQVKVITFLAVLGTS